MDLAGRQLEAILGVVCAGRGTKRYEVSCSE